MKNIKRREALKRAAWIMGGVISAPTIAGIMNGCTPKPELTWEPKFFTEDQARLVMQVAETIIPETGTPGAKSLGVPGFIEEMVSTVYSPEDRDEFVKGLVAFDKECQEKLGDDFVGLDTSKQKEFCTQKDTEMKKTWDRSFFWKMKELTIVGYYTTEYGTTEALQYTAIPVEQHGCVPIDEAGNGKVWAT
ncbi:MAG: gluconate 2-dehydrogenase subunit 3 family protein [Marinoscillum sp.]